MKLHTKNASRRWRTRTMMAVAAAIGSVVMLIAAPGAAQADGGQGRFSNMETYLCLDGNEVGNVYTSSCDGSNPWLTWEETSTPLGAHQLRSLATNRCLDSNYDGVVYTNPCDRNNLHQNWRWNGEGGGHIQNAATNLCLDSNHARQVYTLPCQAGNRYQDWA